MLFCDASIRYVAYYLGWSVDLLLSFYCWGCGRVDVVLILSHHTFASQDLSEYIYNDMELNFTWVSLICVC